MYGDSEHYDNHTVFYVNIGIKKFGFQILITLPRIIPSLSHENLTVYYHKTEGEIRLFYQRRI